MTDTPRPFWQELRHQLFRFFFREEAETLTRYRHNLQELERWMPHHVPEVVTTCKWLRHHSEPRIPLGEVSSGLDVSRLRDHLFRSRILSLRSHHSQFRG